MTLLAWTIIATIIICLVVVWLENKTSQKNRDVEYLKKEFLTEPEKRFLYIIKKLEKSHQFIIIPQVNLASIISKISNSKWQTELYRNIDFGIFDSNYNLLLLIELNDYSHQRSDRYQRDLKVKNICKKAGVKLINFYTNKSNKENYVLNRIIETINSQAC